MNGWPFPDPPNVATITTRSIVEGGRWIALVTHDLDDGGWQFHCGDTGMKREDDARIVSLRSMVDRDPSLANLADLPLGWRAWRESPDAPWQRAPQ